MQMNFSIEPADCHCGLYQFYENVAKKMGVVVTDSTLFDCRKICVTDAVQKELYDYYMDDENATIEEIATLFLAFGPKANLIPSHLYLVHTEDGFVVDYSMPLEGENHG